MHEITLALEGLGNFVTARAGPCQLAHGDTSFLGTGLLYCCFADLKFSASMGALTKKIQLGKSGAAVCAPGSCRSSKATACSVRAIQRGAFFVRNSRLAADIVIIAARIRRRTHQILGSYAPSASSARSAVCSKLIEKAAVKLSRSI